MNSNSRNILITEVVTGYQITGSVRRYEYHIYIYVFVCICVYLFPRCVWIYMFQVYLSREERQEREKREKRERYIHRIHQIIA